MTQHIVELLYVTRDPAWAPWAVQYFFLIGLSVGALILSLPGVAFGRESWREPSRMALLAALVCGLAAPVALLSDLNQPGRFLNFYLHPQPHSWMSWGAFFIPAYVGLLLLYAWAALAPDFRATSQRGGVLAPVQRLLGGAARPGVTRAFGLLTLVAAALVALYTGAEVMIVKARPLWDTGLLPLQFLATALAGAIGLVLLLERFVGAGDRSVEVRLNRLLAATLAGVSTLGLVWFGLAEMPGTTESIALRQVAGSEIWLVYAAWSAAAILVPLAIAALKPGGTGVLTGLLALHAAWMFRWIVFIGGQNVPKTGAGFYASHIALGPDGWTGIVGTAGLWLLILVALTTLLPWSGASHADTSKTIGA
jgi:tetrathionate reductase subunit C